MSSSSGQNLTNVYAYLRKEYQDVDMMYSKPVSYIKTLTGIDNKVIFIYKEVNLIFHSFTRWLTLLNLQDQNKIKSLHAPFFGSIKSEKNSDDLDLTGSPLKDDTSIDAIMDDSLATKMHFAKPWKAIEENYMPIDINLAREILNNVSNHEFPKDSSGWIFVLCSSENGKGPIMLSSRIHAKDHIRGIMNYNQLISHQDMSIDDLLARHFSFISSSSKLNTQVESLFEMTPNINLKFINVSTARNPSAFHIDESSEVILNQKVEVGKGHLLCENLWSQILLLNCIKNDILNSRTNSFEGTIGDPTYSYGSNELTFENLQERVNRILSEMVIIKEEDEKLMDTGLESVVKRTQFRPLTDITDQLWDLLKFSNSYHDLKRIITFIFQISSRSNIVNIPTNNNRLGELIRELSQQRLAIPNLTSTEPLELLLEIGIEKMMKDYEFIFNESKICNLSDMKFGEGKSQTKATDNRLSVRKSLAAGVDLNPEKARKTLLHGGGSQDSNDEMENGIRNSRFNEREVEFNISRLSQIHLIVEHLLLIQSNLSLDNDYKSITQKLMEKSLVPFDTLKEQKYDSLVIPIMNKKMSQLVENLIPNAQKITMRSENKFKTIESIFDFNLEMILPSLALSETELDEMPEKKNDLFHFISYTAITSKA